MQINNTKNTPSFKSRVKIANPQKLIQRVGNFYDITTCARTTQDMIDTVTLAQKTAPLVGEKKDVIKLDFGEVNGLNDLVKVNYNNKEMGSLFVSLHPLIAIADIFEHLTDGIITRSDSLAQFRGWGSFDADGKNGQIQRTLHCEKGKWIDSENTTLEALTLKLKQLVGLT